MKNTKEQQAITKHKSGHSLVIAVPGSGKTHSLVGRVGQLLNDGVASRTMLVIMFGKSAQLDFYRRLKKVTKPNTPLPQVRTFHSLASNMLKRLIALGIVEDWKLDDSNSRYQYLCRETLKAQGLSDGREEIESLQGIITWIKARCANEIHYQGEKQGQAVELFNQFEVLRKQNKIRFFDDLIFDLVQALNQDIKLHQLFNNRLKHITLDEYQDINPMQQALVDILASGRDEKGKSIVKASIMAVGDIDQTIYEFRGSDPDIMLNQFSEKYKNVTQLKLSKTFRFGSDLSKLAASLIQQNQNRFEIECVSADTTEKTDIRYITQNNYLPVLLVDELKTSQAELKDIAILCREFSHSVATEVEFIAAGVPYNIDGSDGILSHSSIKSLFGYSLLADNAEPFLKLSLEDRKSIITKMFNNPALFINGQAKTTLVCRLAENPSDMSAFLEIESQLDKSNQVKQLINRQEIWEFALGISQHDDAVLMLQDLYYQLGYQKYFEFSSLSKEDAEHKRQLVNSIIYLAKKCSDKYATLGQFQSYWSNLTKSASKQTADSVMITSMHRSKGLEWDHVIIPSLHKGKFPTENEDKEVDLEAERRLLYVAITRARKSLRLIIGDESCQREPSILTTPLLDGLISKNPELSAEVSP